MVVFMFPSASHTKTTLVTETQFEVTVCTQTTAGADDSSRFPTLVSKQPTILERRTE
ncbi:hypothetical protein HALLA_19185 [Halostagnicola larsenii XH-48]|uniref:Uncharacterized protein n=1 Tax=Halostagnicola larsenii XH-48 TaxID=797299 RepID=W0JVT8_9EURY|nr:hypothetical protein HALLA_19185 [Halostagnicola larsenii XH-48]